MKKPLVSFVMRTKNEGKYIGKILGLLQKQTFQNFEIIIVDSGSTDKTLEIIKNFKHSLIKIKQSEFTYGKALNIGIKASKGKYICILSGHSVPITDSWLSDGISVLREDGVAAVSSYYSEKSIGYFSRFIGSLDLIYRKKREDFTPWITNSNSLIKKSLWEKYHFDETLDGCEDYDWGKEMISRGYNVVRYRPFSVFHSHKLIGRPGYNEMLPKWNKWIAMVDKKKRPSK